MLMAGTQAKSGATVTAATSLSVSSVLACATAIAEDLALCPWKVRQMIDETHSRDARTHSLYPLLQEAPNGYQTAWEFRVQRTFHVVLTGNAFALIVRMGGKVIELLPFEPNTVTIRYINGSSYDIEYDVSFPNGTKTTIPAGSMWHTRGRQWSMHLGLDSVRLAREAIGLALATESHSAQLFGNGARPGGLLSTERILTPEQTDMIRTNWEKIYGGDQSGKTAVLMGGMKFEHLAFDAAQSGQAEIRKFQVEEIARAMGVFPARIGYSDKASTYASVEQFFLAHAKFTIAPRALSFDQSADRALLTPEDRAAGFYTKHNLKGLLQGASKERSEFYASAILNGWMTRNDVRILEDMNPIEGLDTPLRPLNTTDGTAEIVDPTADVVAPVPADAEKSRVNLAVNVDARSKTVTKIGTIRKDPVTGLAHFELTETSHV